MRYFRKMIYRTLFIIIISLSTSASLFSSVIKGAIKDSTTGEALVGATIYIKELQKGSVSGLDGTYTIKNVPDGKYSVTCSFIGYQTIEKDIIINEEINRSLNFLLAQQTNELSQVVITAHAETNNDISARTSEKMANQVLSVVSAKTIELSPDISVANVIQRVSGVIIERDATGDGQYALLRGMDKRFNYTMVNGVKIPSPDNKNRFVPLDIFPAELLDRLEVTKSLTANLEGDGIGGAVNLIMKDAPSKMQLSANMAVGYNSLFLENNYEYFVVSAINKKSPSEEYGLAYPVQMKDFSTKNLRLESGSASPNLSGGFSYGNRFFKERLGIILAASYQKSDRGNSSNLYGNSTNTDGNQNITRRFYSNQQVRLGIHAKIDIKLSPDHKIMWYNTYMDFTNAQVREAVSFNSQTTRLRWNNQTIMNSTLKGYHSFIDSRLNLDWSVSYGKALNETPDNVQINELILNGLTSIDQNEGATRRWEHNSDNDLSVNGNLQYRFKFLNGSILDLSTGGMYRDKVRGSYYNEYIFKPYDPTKLNPQEQIRGLDYNNFNEISFSVNSYGDLSNPLNYAATEKIGAVYFMQKLSLKSLQFVIGVRAEYTNQGFNLKFPTEGARNEGNQEYIDILPSFGFKYSVHKNANLRLTYYKALNRPSFFEIVPYSIIYEDYKERGNPDLKHTTANNLDIRYEFFPTPAEQFMAGIFYKNIRNPIEFGMMNGFGQDQYYMPMNFGNATNYGIEMDIIKYFNWFGLKANYTYTNSNITTTKMKVISNPDPDAETNFITEYVNQTRPLYGQAVHVINLSLLLKDNQNGWDGQLSFSYTSDRLVIVSRFLNDDSWQAGYTTVDVSVEKRFRSGLVLFAKATNLLNAPMIQYVKPNDTNALYTSVARFNSGVVERKEHYGINCSIGIKFKFV